MDRFFIIKASFDRTLLQACNDLTVPVFCIRLHCVCNIAPKNILQNNIVPQLHLYSILQPTAACLILLKSYVFDIIVFDISETYPESSVLPAEELFHLISQFFGQDCTVDHFDLNVIRFVFLRRKPFASSAVISSKMVTVINILMIIVKTMIEINILIFLISPVNRDI